MLEIALTIKDAERKYQLTAEVSEDAVACLSLPFAGDARPEISKTILLSELIGAYIGPDVVFDIGEGNVLLGIEVLV